MSVSAPCLGGLSRNYRTASAVPERGDERSSSLVRDFEAREESKHSLPEVCLAA